jgi:hypothetical protein
MQRNIEGNREEGCRTQQTMSDRALSPSLVAALTLTDTALLCAADGYKRRALAMSALATPIAQSSARTRLCIEAIEDEFTDRPAGTSDDALSRVAAACGRVGALCQPPGTCASCPACASQWSVSLRRQWIEYMCHVSGTGVQAAELITAELGTGMTAQSFSLYCTRCAQAAIMEQGSVLAPILYAAQGAAGQLDEESLLVLALGPQHKTLDAAMQLSAAGIRCGAREVLLTQHRGDGTPEGILEHLVPQARLEAVLHELAGQVDPRLFLCVLRDCMEPEALVLLVISGADQGHERGTIWFVERAVNECYHSRRPSPDFMQQAVAAAARAGLVGVLRATQQLAATFAPPLNYKELLLEYCRVDRVDPDCITYLSGLLQ